VTNGAAVLAYYLMLASFPAAILLLSLLPYLPIPNLDRAIVDLMHQIMPDQAAQLFTSTVESVVSERRGGLLSVGVLGTLWAASTGIHAVMQQLNVTYDVKETRPFWKTRGLALLLVFGYGILVVGAFALVVFGGILQTYLSQLLGWNRLLLGFFSALRWIIILAMIMGALSVMYYFGPNVKHRFKLVSPGGIVGTVLLVLASLSFRLYVANFGKYEATYGSIGAVIVMLLWLYVAGLVVLIGSEVNSLLEGYAKGRLVQNR
jgi:membrane protein